jgi:hypothetical protein
MATPRKAAEDLLKRGAPLKWTPEALENLKKELMEFVERPDVWHLSAFCLHKKMSQNFLNNIEAYHPEFSEVIEAAHRVLGNRMLRHCMETKQSSKAIDLCMIHYLGERRRVLKEKKEDATVTAEAAREVMMKDPDHPFWAQFTQFIQATDAKST